MKKNPSMLAPMLTRECVASLPPCAPKCHTVLDVYAFTASVTGTLALHVSPPSSDADARSCQPRLSPALRRSYHETSTTPSLFTPIDGRMWSGPFAAFSGERSSLTTTGLDHVLPSSEEYETTISMRLPLTAHATIYTRSVWATLPQSAAS